MSEYSARPLDQGDGEIACIMDMTTNKRSLQKAATRAAVIAAAGRVFRSKGYAAATIAVIAEEARVSAGTVLNAASTKIALLNLVMAEEFTALGGDSETLRAGLSGDFTTAVNALLELHLNRHFETLPMMGPLLAECWMSEGEEFERFYENMDRAWGAIRAILEEAKADGRVSNRVEVEPLVGFLQDAYLGVLRRCASRELSLMQASDLLRLRLSFVFEPVSGKSLA
jgi:AcrR family transcriptional regulator